MCWTYHLDKNLDKLSLVTRLDSREDLAVAAAEGAFLLLLGELLELSTGEARALNVGVLGDDIEFLGDRDGCFFSVASDHDNIDAGCLALLDGFLAFRPDWVLNADVANECQIALEFLVLASVSKLLLSVS